MTALAQITVPTATRSYAEFRDVSKSYQSAGKTFEVLSGFDLTIKEGEFLAVVGPSGSGKSTLLNLLAGLDSPTGGEVICNAKPVRGVNAGIGYITQQDNLLPWLTVAQNISLSLEIRGVPAAERGPRVADMIDKVGLRGFEHHHPGKLSGGMRKRAMLARTLVYEPSIIIMDEPFGPLDAQLKVVMQAELLKLWSATGATVVFVTHDIVEAITLADRVVVLSHRPSRIKLNEVIKIPRPREVHEVRFAPGFEDHYRSLWAAIEVSGAAGEEGA